MRALVAAMLLACALPARADPPTGPPPPAPASAPAPAPARPSAIAPTFRPLSEEIQELERIRLREALAASDGVKAKAARLIGMPLRTFVAKLKQHGIAVDRAD